MNEVKPENRRVRLAEIVPHRRNYNRHPASQVERIAASLRKFGQVRSIVVWRSTILAGHGVVEAARSLGWQEVAADVLPDEYPEHLALAYVAADNELGRLSDPDQAALAAILEESKAADAELLAAIGYSDSEFEALLAEVGRDTGEAGRDTEAQVDRAEELRQKWNVEPGQLWQLGEHRLVCGDCTDAAVVARVMAGEKANGVFTSPPYAMQRANTYGGVAVDQYVDWWEGIQANIKQILAIDGSFFVNIKPHAEDGERVLYVFDLVLAMRRRWGWCFIDEFCWRRNGMPGSWNNRFKNGFEPIYQFAGTVNIKFVPTNVANKEAKGIDKTRESKNTGTYYNKGFTWDSALPSNHLDIAENVGIVNHPAAFPCRLPEFFVTAFSDGGDIWFEPFSGSGTTLIACENLGRRCRAVEIAPGYVAVALERWATHTGKVPVLVD